MGTQKYWVPKLISFVILLSGTINILSAFRRLALMPVWVERLVPLEVQDASRSLTVLSGFFLLYLAYGVWKRKILAWWLCVTTILISVVLHLTRGIGFSELVTQLLPLVLLIVYKRQFVVFSSKDTFKSRLKTALVVLITTIIYAFFGFFLFQGQFIQHVTVDSILKDYEYTVLGVGKDVLIPKTRRALVFEDSISVLGLSTSVIIFGALFAPVGWLGESNDEDWRLARKLIKKYGRNPTSFLGLMADKQYFFSEAKQSLIIYKIKSGTAVVLGDPLGDPVDIDNCVQQFCNKMGKNGLNICFFQASETFKPLYKRMGLKILQIGCDAIVRLREFSLSGPKMKNLRNSVTHALSEDLKFTWYNMEEIPWGVMHRINNLHKFWLLDKGNQGLTFSMGYYPFPPESTGSLLVVEDKDENMEVVLSFFPYANEKGQTLDMMLRSVEATSGIVEAALVESIKHFASIGSNEMSLGFAAIEAQKELDWLYRQLDVFYGYQSIAKFKTKFYPVWEPRFLVYSSDVELPKTILALVQAHMEKTIWQMLWRKDYD